MKIKKSEILSNGKHRYYCVRKKTSLIDEYESDAPTSYPTKEPTPFPTNAPTNSPTKDPTNSPTKDPTNSPTKDPTNSPTKEPTNSPTKEPTNSPTKEPTDAPTRGNDYKEMANVACWGNIVSKLPDTLPSTFTGIKSFGYSSYGGFCYTNKHNRYKCLHTTQTFADRTMTASAVTYNQPSVYHDVTWIMNYARNGWGTEYGSCAINNFKKVVCKDSRFNPPSSGKYTQMVSYANNIYVLNQVHTALGGHIIRINTQGAPGAEHYTYKASDFGLTGTVYFKHVATAGQNNICAVTSNNRIVCTKESLRPTDTSINLFVKVSASSNHVCGLHGFSFTSVPKYRVACWGSNTYGESDTPAHTDVTSVAALYEATCITRLSGSVACWGNPSRSVVHSYPLANKYTTLEKGNTDVEICSLMNIETSTTTPTRLPTQFPTDVVSVPTNVPTVYEYEPFGDDEYEYEYETLAPTKIPTQFPTFVTTKFPTNFPTQFPTFVTTKFPTNFPTQFPTFESTRFPTRFPTQFPTSGGGIVFPGGGGGLITSPTPSPTSTSIKNIGNNMVCWGRVVHYINRYSSWPASVQNVISVSMNSEDDAICYINEHSGEKSHNCIGDKAYSLSGTDFESSIALVRGSSASTCGMTSLGNVICGGSDRYLHTPPPRWHNFVQISGYSKNSYTLRGTGQVVRWLNTVQSSDPNHHVQLIPSVHFGMSACSSCRGGSSCSYNSISEQCEELFTYISASKHGVCGVTRTGKIGCTGGTLTPTPTGSDFTKVAMSETHACALRTNGRVACWGSNSNGESSAPTYTFKEISVSDKTSCGIRTIGSIVCWGKAGLVKDHIPPNDVKYDKITSYGDSACAIRDTGVVPTPFPSNRPTLNPTPYPTNEPVHCGDKDGVGCVIRTEADRPICNRCTCPENANKVFETMSNGLSRYFCYVNTKFPTFEPTTRAPTKYPSNNPTRIPTSFPTNIPTDNPTKIPTSFPTKSPVSPTRYPTAATKYPTTQNYREVANLVCWGRSARLLPHSTTTSFFNIKSVVFDYHASFGDTFCYTNGNDDQYCMGGITNSFTNTNNYKNPALATRNGIKMCVMKEERTTMHSIQCVTASNAPPFENYIQLVASENYFYGLRSQGMIVKWSSTTPYVAKYHYYEHMDPVIDFGLPSGSKISKMSAIRDGNGGICVITTSGKASCTSTRLQAPTTISTFTEISASSTHACAIYGGGRVMCWGDNSYGKTEAPTFTDCIGVAVSPHVSCVIRSSNVVHCWGKHDDSHMHNAPSVKKKYTSIVSDSSGFCAFHNGDVGSSSTTRTFLRSG